RRALWGAQAVGYPELAKKLLLNRVLPEQLDGPILELVRRWEWLAKRVKVSALAALDSRQGAEGGRHLAIGFGPGRAQLGALDKQFSAAPCHGCIHIAAGTAPLADAGSTALAGLSKRLAGPSSAPM